MNIRNKRTNQFQSVVYSVREKRIFRNVNELPAELLRLSPTPNRMYPYREKLRVTARDLTVDNTSMSLIEGGQAAAKPNGPINTYWVTLFKGDKRSHYLGHRWSIQACTYSPQAGLCASADKYGQIHVWRPSKNGRPVLRKDAVHIFQPINANFYHVEWFPDESGFYLGSQSFKGRDFYLNHYGGVDWAFDLKNWKLKTVDNYNEAFREAPQTVDPQTRERYTLKTTITSASTDLILTSSRGMVENLSQQYRNLGVREKQVAKKWGRPTCVQFLDVKTDGRLPFLVGTDNGSILQFSIENQNGRNQLRLRRRFLAHEAQITSLSTSPSGRLFASVGLDGTARVWRLDPARTLADVDFYTDGTSVIDIPNNGPSMRAGIRPRDAILTFDGKPYYERIQAIQSGKYKPGDSVVIEASRSESDNNGGARRVRRSFNVQLVPAEDIGEPVFNLFITKEREWIGWSQKGFYNSTPGGQKHVGWHVNQSRDKAAEFSFVSQFEKQLYRPDLLEQVISNWQPIDLNQIVEGATASPVVSNGQVPTPVGKSSTTLKSSGMQSVLVLPPSTVSNYEKARPPKILIQSPYSSTTTEDKSVKLEFDLQSPNELPVYELKVFNNGREVATSPEPLGDAKQEDGIATLKYALDVELTPGKNKIVVRGKHRAARSNDAEVNVTCSALNENSDLPKLYILSIGVSKYAQEENNLDFAHVDARDFVDVWKLQEGKMYREVEAKVVVDEEATRDGIEEAFEWLTEKELTTKDIVFVFFAGHAGFTKKDIWVFGSHEMDQGNLKRKGISENRVKELLDQELSDAGLAMLFLDTCHAGGARGKTRGRPAMKVHHSIDNWRNCQTRVFASCMQKEFSQEHSDWENGAFTEGLKHTLTEGLKSRKLDYNNDGYLDIRELQMTTRNYVVKLTDQSQTPTETGSDLNRGITYVAKFDSEGDPNPAP